MFAAFLLITSVVVSLKLGGPVRHPIAGGQSAVFQLPIASPILVAGVVNQGDADLVIDVFEPAGARIARFDQRDRDDEIVAFRAVAPGAYRIEIATVNRSAPRTMFGLSFDAAAAGDDHDSLLRAAELTTEAKALLGKRDRTSAEIASRLLADARALWHDAGRHDAALAALVAEADAHYAMANFAAADRLYREALPISRDLRNARTEGEILNNLAMQALPRGQLS